MTINELPMVLTVHLKRFAFDLQRGYMRKIGTPVKFTEHLDLAPYMSKDKRVTEASYNLHAVLVHLGHGCDSGHYYAYVKAPDGQWYRMDDEDVQAVSLNEVMSQNAYMLFYSQDRLIHAANTTKTQPIIPETPPVVIQAPPPVHAKKVLVDRTNKEKPKKKKKVVMEPEVISDHPQVWVVNTPKSLRGDFSPNSYSANVREAWTKETTEECSRRLKLKNRRRYRKKLEQRKSPFHVGSFTK